MSEVILIVGGTTGIGYETAKYLSIDDRYQVVVCGLGSVKSEPFEFIETDIRSELAVQDLCKRVRDGYGSIHGLVFCAGITTKIKPIEQFDETIWNDIIDTNVTGFLRIIKSFHLALKETAGRVVVINSIAGKTYSKYSGLEYTASKAALSGIVRQLAMEWSGENIMINSIVPSMTLTPMLSRTLDPEAIAKLEDELPLKRLLTPIEIARVVEFLINKDNGYITGSGIDINGGLFLNG